MHAFEVISVVSNSATPWTVARQAPLCMGFSRQDTGVGCHDLLQGIFSTQGLNPSLFCLLHRQAGSLPLAPLYARITIHFTCVSEDVLMVTESLPRPVGCGLAGREPRRHTWHHWVSSYEPGAQPCLQSSSHWGCRGSHHLTFRHVTSDGSLPRPPVPTRVLDCR